MEANSTRPAVSEVPPRRWAVGSSGAPPHRRRVRRAPRASAASPPQGRPARRRGRRGCAASRPVDPLVHAGELLGPAQGEDPLSAPPGSVRVDRVSPHDGFAEEQFGVVRVDRQPRGAGRQRLVRLAEHLMGAGDQGVELPRDRVGRRRARQAATQQRQGLEPLLAFDGDGAEVEQDERVVGPLLQLVAKDAGVARSFRARTARSEYPVCRTVRSVQRTGIPARRGAGSICSWTR